MIERYAFIISKPIFNYNYGRLFGSGLPYEIRFFENSTFRVIQPFAFRPFVGDPIFDLGQWGD